MDKERPAGKLLQDSLWQLQGAGLRWFKVYTVIKGHLTKRSQK